MDRGTLVRSYTAGRSRASYFTRAININGTLAMRRLRQSPARTLGRSLRERFGPTRSCRGPLLLTSGKASKWQESEELKAFPHGGLSGQRIRPFLITNPADAVESVRPPEGMSPARFENREKFYQALVAQSPVGQFGSDYQRELASALLDNAHRLLSSPASKAFDSFLEPKENYNTYNTGRFGLGCLLARRLVEAGARFIEVTSEYCFHLSISIRTKTATRAWLIFEEKVDAPVRNSCSDLEARGLLDRTLIGAGQRVQPRRAGLKASRTNRSKTRSMNRPKVDDLKFYGCTGISPTRAAFCSLAAESSGGTCMRPPPTSVRAKRSRTRGH